MDVGEGTGTGALLLDAGRASGLGLHATLGDEDNVTVGELLLELAGESSERGVGERRIVRFEFKESTSYDLPVHTNGQPYGQRL